MVAVITFGFDLVFCLGHGTESGRLSGIYFQYFSFKKQEQIKAVSG